MQIANFATEHFFARYEFTTPHLLGSSDCESITVAELLALAGVTWDEFGRLSLGYTESLGHPELRRQIAASYASVHAEEIIMLGAPVEGIYLMARAALAPNDEVIVLTPAYDALLHLFEHVVGVANVKRWTFTPGAGRWELDFDALHRLITPRTKLLVVNFPHNPTGYLPTPAQMHALTALVEQHGLLLFCDEMYFGLVHGDTPAIASAADLTPRAVVLSGLSKTYGLPGLRTGWLVVKDADLRANLINWKFYTTICPPAPSEFLALAAWRVREQLRSRNLTRIATNLQLAEDFFARWPELFQWRRPLAGSTALVGMNVPSVRDYATHLAENAGVLVLPAANLGAEDHYLRMGFGRAGFDAALAAFEAHLRAERKSLK
ncbi:MAG TPA: pyridoxal phosphate-dependent aminotransferase [Chloroflexi bacterium]|nr:pyridoxal phosphate-dependent aminotransferase [Chloroflexota bacterium]